MLRLVCLVYKQVAATVQVCADSEVGNERELQVYRLGCCDLFALCANRLQQPCRCMQICEVGAKKSGTDEVKLTRHQKDPAKTLIDCLLLQLLFVELLLVLCSS